MTNGACLLYAWGMTYLLDFLSPLDGSKITVSIPHYFALAMEAGWSDEQAFILIASSVEKAQGNIEGFSDIKQMCDLLFSQIKEAINETDNKIAGRVMRKLLEKK